MVGSVNSVPTNAPATPAPPATHLEEYIKGKVKEPAAPAKPEPTAAERKACNIKARKETGIFGGNNQNLDHPKSKDELAEFYNNRYESCLRGE